MSKKQAGLVVRLTNDEADALEASGVKGIKRGTVDARIKEIEAKLEANEKRLQEIDLELQALLQHVERLRATLNV